MLVCFTLELKQVIETNLAIANETKQALYKLLLCFNSHLKQLYISTKTEHFRWVWYMYIKAFKRRDGLGYR